MLNHECVRHPTRSLAAASLTMLCIMMLFGINSLFAMDKNTNTAVDSLNSKAYETLPYNRQVLLNKINRRIDKLQMSYINQLYKSERHEAQILLDEIRKVANLLAYTAPVAPQVITIKEAPTVTINVAPPEPAVPKLRAMNNEDFLDLKQSIRRNNFGDAGLNTLRSAVEGNHFKSTQIVDILGLFAFSVDKLKALEIVYPKCLDTQSKFKILDAFLFDSDKKEAQEIMDKVKK